MISPTDPGRDRAGLGRASVLYDLRIVDEHDDELPPGKTGQIVVPARKGIDVLGYWRNPAATAASWRNLWHHTGDLGWLDDDGRLQLSSTAPRTRSAGGARTFSCFQVEQAIGLHPAVAQVAPRGRPREGKTTSRSRWYDGRPHEEGLGDLVRLLFPFFREHLPYYAIPQYVEFRESFPLTATGRVRKEQH